MEKLKQTEAERILTRSRFLSKSALAQLKYWLPGIAIAIPISVFSTHNFSREQTSHVFLPVLRWLFPFAGHHTLYLMHVGIRKLAHVTEFAAFSAALFYGVRAERYGWKLEWAVFALLIAVIYAGLDEWHQSFVPLRDSRPSDVMIDSAGALLAQALVWVYVRMHRIPRDPCGFPPRPV